jgi:hypothetical protein
VGIIDHGELLVLDEPQALKCSMGEGDVLEIHLNARSSQAASSSADERARQALAGLPVQVIASPAGDTGAARPERHRHAARHPGSAALQAWNSEMFGCEPIPWKMSSSS